MTRVDVYYNAKPIFQGDFEVVPRVEEFLYLNKKFFKVSNVWHNFHYQGIAQVQLDFVATKQSWKRD